MPKGDDHTDVSKLIKTQWNQAEARLRQLVPDNEADEIIGKIRDAAMREELGLEDV
jgi:hypothetical protein